jgi:hypothetical protein
MASGRALQSRQCLRSLKVRDLGWATSERTIVLFRTFFVQVYRSRVHIGSYIAQCSSISHSIQDRNAIKMVGEQR